MNLSLAQWAQLFGNDESAAVEVQWQNLSSNGTHATGVPLEVLEARLREIDGISGEENVAFQLRPLAAMTMLRSRW